MSIVTKKSSKLLLLELITGGKLTFNPEHISIEDVTAVKASDYNTTAVLKGNLRGIVEDTKTIKFTRVDIEKFLGIKRLELLPGDYVNTSELIAPLNLKYGLAFVVSDFVVEPIVNWRTATQVKLKVAPGCPAWYGSIEIVFVNPSVSLATLFTQETFGSIAIDTGVLLNRTNAKFIYWSENFNELQTMFSECVVGQLITQEFVTTLNSTTDEIWYFKSLLSNYNLKGSVIAYHGTTLGCPFEPNKVFTHVLVVEISTKLCNNFGGYLYLHYNA